MFYNYIKKKLSPKYKKQIFLFFNINMINLLLDELILVRKHTNVRDYENKSEKDLIKVLRDQNQK